jgi:hypothetical protein
MAISHRVQQVMIINHGAVLMNATVLPEGLGLQFLVSNKKHPLLGPS